MNVKSIWKPKSVVVVEDIAEERNLLDMQSKIQLFEIEKSNKGKNVMTPNEDIQMFNDQNASPQTLLPDDENKWTQVQKKRASKEKTTLTRSGANKGIITDIVCEC
ncbi:hypothetical protein ACFE04_000489 [Oxalis oulophora]